MASPSREELARLPPSSHRQCPDLPTAGQPGPAAGAVSRSPCRWTFEDLCRTSKVLQRLLGVPHPPICSVGGVPSIGSCPVLDKDALRETRASMPRVTAYPCLRANRCTSMLVPRTHRGCAHEPLQCSVRPVPHVHPDQRWSIGNAHPGGAGFLDVHHAIPGGELTVRSVDFPQRPAHRLGTLGDAPRER